MTRSKPASVTAKHVALRGVTQESRCTHTLPPPGYIAFLVACRHEVCIPKERNDSACRLGADHVPQRHSGKVFFRLEDEHAAVTAQQTQSKKRKETKKAKLHCKDKMIDVRVRSWRWPGSHCRVKRTATCVVTAADTAAACHGHCVRAAHHSLLCAAIAKAAKCATGCALRANRRAANAMAADHSQHGAAAAGGERHAKRLNGMQHHHAELVLHAERQMLGAHTPSNSGVQLTT
jgi:hypothetical protein